MANKPQTANAPFLRPTPTQEENDLVALGEHFLQREQPGEPSSPEPPPDENGEDEPPSEPEPDPAAQIGDEAAHQEEGVEPEAYGGRKLPRNPVGRPPRRRT